MYEYVAGGALWQSQWEHFLSQYMCSVTHCNTLQHTVTHCNTLQRIATHCNTLQHTITGMPAAESSRTPSDSMSVYCNTLHHTATHCDTLQHTATHCNTLQPGCPQQSHREHLLIQCPCTAESSPARPLSFRPTVDKCVDQ